MGKRTKKPGGTFMRIFFAGVFCLISSFCSAASPLNARILSTMIEVSPGDVLSFQDAQSLYALNLISSQLKPGEVYTFFYSSLRHCTELCVNQLVNQGDKDLLEVFKRECEEVQNGHCTGYKGVLLEEFRNDFVSFPGMQKEHFLWIRQHKVNPQALQKFATIFSTYAQKGDEAVEEFFAYVDRQLARQYPEAE